MDEPKIEENNNEANSSSWWGWGSSWLQSAKEKSNTALEFMKRDLTEFSQVVQTDAVAAVSSTATILKEKLTLDNAEAIADKARQSFTSALGTIADAFVPHRELEEGEELLVVRDSHPVPMDWWQSQLYLIRKDPKTFCHEPEGPPDIYESWLESFDPEEYQEEMTEITMACSEIRALYDKLVPASVSHLEFWRRYFYRVHLLEIASARRNDLMRRAEQISIDNIQWAKDDGEPTDATRSANPASAPTSPRPRVNDEDDSCSRTRRQAKGHTICKTELILGTSSIAEGEAVTSEPTSDSPSRQGAKAEELSDDLLLLGPSSSAESTDGSRCSPIESLGKGSSTGDDWEKDFDLEINESDLKKNSSQPDSRKEDDEEWEKWQ